MSEVKVIGIGNDHAAVDLKNEIKAYLEEKGYKVVNYGTDSSESCDYPIYGAKVGHAVASGEVDAGVLICGTGIGISIAANKVNDTARIETLNEAMKEAEKPFASEYIASREKLLDEEKEVNLTLIDRDMFDAATEACDFSMKIYVEFAFMFKTNKKEVLNEKD